MPDEGRTPLVLCWQLSSYFGYGVHGTNVVMQLANNPVVAPLTAYPFWEVVADPLRAPLLERVGRQSRTLWDAIATPETGAMTVNGPVLHPIGEDFLPRVVGHEKRLVGSPDVGIAIFHDTRIVPDAPELAKQFNPLVVSSTWQHDLLREHGIGGTIITIPHGVDTTLFHPAPRCGVFPGRFVIVSAGKIEYRKAQDIVLRAFRIFHTRHPDSLLLTAWQSPWPGIAMAQEFGEDIVPLQKTDGDTIDVLGWAAANGIPEGAVVDVGRIANLSMAHVMREADVALFPNRGEAGTNMPATECIACGIPTIVSANTGHLDLIADGAAKAMTRQGPVVTDRYGTEGWGESDVEEILEALELFYTSSNSRAWFSQMGGAAMAECTWRRHTDKLLMAISEAA